MKKALLATAAFAVMGLAQATPIYINNGVDFDAGVNPGTTTGAFDELGYAGTRATSIYLGAIAPGTQVIDTNIKSVMDFYGFSAGTKTTLSGGSFNAAYPVSPNGLNIDDLQYTTDQNGFTNGSSAAGTSWGLTYQYKVVGTVTATGVAYSSGYFDIFYNTGATSTQVLRMNVTGSSLNAANLTLFGNVSFDFDGNGTNDAASNSLVQNFWNDANPNGVSFYQKWLADPVAISWQLDTNVAPPLPTANQLWAEAGGLFRQASSSGIVAFNVPEPATLALMGLALAGAGAVSRRRKQA